MTIIQLSKKHKTYTFILKRAKIKLIIGIFLIFGLDLNIIYSSLLRFLLNLR